MKTLGGSLTDRAVLIHEYSSVLIQGMKEHPNTFGVEKSLLKIKALDKGSLETKIEEVFLRYLCSVCLAEKNYKCVVLFWRLEKATKRMKDAFLISFLSF